MTRRHAAVLLVPFAVAACAGVLGIRSLPTRPFEHRAHVVGGVACTHCHTKVARSTARSPLDLPTTPTCTGCHQEPHTQQACGDCHGTQQNRHDVAQAKQHLVFSHATHSGTGAGNCARCHEGVLQRDGALRPTMATCLSCHEHREQWAERSCLPCHEDLEGEQVRPASHVVHGEDFMQRHGLAAASSRDLCTSCHTESACAACHGVNVPALPQQLHFEDPQRPDMHARGFLARHAIEARIDPTTCTSCHRDQDDCRACHEKRGLLQASAVRGSPHPADWLSTTSNRHGREARQNPMSCASCHGGAGESLCVDCHRVGAPGGNPHPPGFSTRKSYSELPCRLCHTEAR